MAFCFRRNESVAKGIRCLGGGRIANALDGLVDCRQTEAIHHVRNGYGKKALQLALGRLREWGATRALLTVHPNNTASARVVQANGGVRDGQGKDQESAEIADRYWIEL